MNYKIKEVKLNNGVEGIIIDVPNSRTACSRIVFNGGYWSVRDYADKQQTPHLYEHVANYVKRRSEWDSFNKEFKKNGGYYNAFTNNTCIRYVAKCPVFDIDRIVRMQKYAVENPDYTETDLAVEKKSITNELLADAGKTPYLLDYAMWSSVGLPRMAPHDAINTLKNINLNDVDSYRVETHTTSNMRFLLAGDFGGNYSIANTFSNIDLPVGERILTKKTCSINRQPSVVSSKGSIVSARIGFALHRPLTAYESMIMWLIGILLAGDRETRVYGKARSAGLVYAMAMRNSVQRDATVDYFMLRCKPDNLSATTKLIAEGMKSVVQGEISERELEETKKKLIGFEYMLYETPEAILNAMENRYISLGEIIDIESRPDIIRSIELNDVVRLASEFVNSGIRPMVLCGNVSDYQVNQAYGMLNEILG